MKAAIVVLLIIVAAYLSFAYGWIKWGRVAGALGLDSHPVKS